MTLKKIQKQRMFKTFMLNDKIQGASIALLYSEKNVLIPLKRKS